MDVTLEERSVELHDPSPPDGSTEIALTDLVPADSEIVLEPIDYSNLTTDQLCAEWLTIGPNDLRREAKLDEIARCLSGKVDRLDELHANSEANADAFDAMAARYHKRYCEPLENRAQQERNRAKGIEDLLLFVMSKNDLMELSGANAIAKLKSNDHNPKAIWKREATAADMAKYGEAFVEMIPHRFAFIEKNCKKAVMEKQLTDLDALELKPKKSIKFEVAVEVIAIPPKQKKLKKVKA